MDRSFLSRHARALFVGGLVALLVSVALGFSLAYQGSLDHLGVSDERAQPGNLTLSLVDVPRLAGNERLAVTYALSSGADLWLVGCDDVARLRAGESPARPLLERHGDVRGGFELEDEELRDLLPAGCMNATVAYRVPEGEADEIHVQAYTRGDPFQTPFAYGLLAVGTGGAVALLLGSFSGAGMLRPDLPPAALPGESMMEAFLRLAARAESWLARTRRYLLVLGVVGLLPWYGVVLTLFLMSMLNGGEGASFRWVAIGAAVLVFAFTALWWRRYREIDHELRTWRDRMARLREDEARILDGGA